MYLSGKCISVIVDWDKCCDAQAACLELGVRDVNDLLPALKSRPREANSAHLEKVGVCLVHHNLDYQNGT